MKTKIKNLGLMSLLMFAVVTTLFAQGIKTEKFKVGGNCGSCKTRIEKAAKSLDGVAKADWNMKSGIMEVSFNNSKTSLDKIELAIADAGHDTQLHKATDKAYNALPECCQYKREK
jgi:periplasmic mercuric ion binding protein